MSKKNKQRGKRNEIALAKRLSAERVGTLGKEDLNWGIFSIETKSRERLPVFLINSYTQAKKNAPTGKIPLFILHKLNDKRDNDLVVLSLKDFEGLLNG